MFGVGSPDGVNGLQLGGQAGDGFGLGGGDGLQFERDVIAFDAGGVGRRVEANARESIARLGHVGDGGEGRRLLNQQGLAVGREPRNWRRRGFQQLLDGRRRLLVGKGGLGNSSGGGKKQDGNQRTGTN